MCTKQCFGYGFRGEDVCLDEDLRFCLDDGVDDCVCAATIGAEEDTDGGIFGESDVRGVYGWGKKEDKREDDGRE